MWADTLKTEELVATHDAVEHLSPTAWAIPLLCRTSSIIDRLRPRFFFSKKELFPSS